MSTESIALKRSCFVSVDLHKIFSVRLTFTDSPLAITPVPEHGASKAHDQKPPITLETHGHHSCTLWCSCNPNDEYYYKRLCSGLLASFAKTHRYFSSSMLKCMWFYLLELLPYPRFFHFSWGCKAITGKKEDAACKNIVSSEIFWGGSDRHLRVENLKSNFCPCSNRLCSHHG